MKRKRNDHTPINENAPDIELDGCSVSLMVMFYMVVFSSAGAVIFAILVDTFL